jgi:hypothetical protein
MKLKSETIYLFGGNGIPILIPGKQTLFQGKPEAM